MKEIKIALEFQPIKLPDYSHDAKNKCDGHCHCKNHAKTHSCSGKCSCLKAKED